MLTDYADADADPEDYADACNADVEDENDPSYADEAASEGTAANNESSEEDGDTPPGVAAPRQVGFTACAPFNPNLVVDADGAFLDSESEGDASPSISPASSSEEGVDLRIESGDRVGSINEELERVMQGLTTDETENLRSTVSSSSRVCTTASELKEMAAHGWNVLPDNTVQPLTVDAVADKMYDGEIGPTREALRASRSPLQLFYFFLPKSFWRHIASESNRYWQQTLDRRIDEALAMEDDRPNRRQLSREQMRSKLKKFQKPHPHELIKWVGLLLAHVLAPRKTLEDQWHQEELGVLPPGTFGQVLTRDRFREISRFLHSSDNEDPASATDRAWKLRPILATLEDTFKRGYVLGDRVSIDEGMLPSRSRFNPTRTYLGNKPHKWGSKCVLTCCANTGYCQRVELDVGKKNSTIQSSDTKSGPAAVVRNLAAVFRGEDYAGRRIVITNRFYTPVPLAQQLRTMGFNLCGTMRTDRIGWCKTINYSFKKRPHDVPRGDFKMATAASDPGLVELAWVDNRPVYFLAPHIPTEMTTVRRREKTGEINAVPCPSIVTEYQQFMGGVDRHDQLRLQSYSLQLATRFAKHYKSLFLGLVDMALVNAYIIYKVAGEKKQRKTLSHYDFLVRLHTDLVKQSARDFTDSSHGVTAIPSVISAIAIGGDHALVQTAETRMNNGVERARQRQCKVCSVYKPADKKRGGVSALYCAKCSAGRRGPLWLCNQVRGHPNNESLTCAQIWHVVWHNGEFMPTSRHLRDRAVPTSQQ